MNWFPQVSRYAIVGLASNAALYALYLLLTFLGVGHKTAMTLLYVVGVLQTFHFNRRWTFGHEGLVAKALYRYWSVSLAGYLINLGLLSVAADKMGLPHQYVQAVAIIVVAMFAFHLNKFWVFPSVDLSDRSP